MVHVPTPFLEFFIIIWWTLEGANKKFWSFRAKFLCENKAWEMCEQINCLWDIFACTFPKLFASRNKVALKPQNSLVTPSSGHTTYMLHSAVHYVFLKPMLDLQLTWPGETFLCNAHLHKYYVYLPWQLY